ncbi:hypothetical protein RSP673_012495 [Ralstonia solanacearum P673]|uniref:hypothetical protein n=1 Tax=Ralstonia solanacearum TaxID=305 RepID=UPI00202AA925|nr:hypothetical protein [Ralstonia solanacearum]MCL9849851.1 hypothetical protein [Ralstonia solanacearum]MCL9856437.1 hypothetical protein [Ralstonia solanacearum]MCL9861203.1 hypothetical protein [Ralstonia solanacearum]MCL9866113.1 hypothetical protein [Ralstonia solanacearum]MCL9870841.1 hypothetical protein [Ralstonia solanacearum]
MEDTIKNLQAQVAALQLFAIALIDHLPNDSAGAAGAAFSEFTRMTYRNLTNAGKRDEAQRFMDAVEDINSRSPSHPAL